MPGWIAPVLAIVVIAAAIIATSVKIIPEYERGIVFRLGKLQRIHQPGLHLLPPGLWQLQRVDLRVVTLTIPPQEVITKDNVPARVNAVVLFNVVDPESAIMRVENYAVATSQIAQTTLRRASFAVGTV
jgi:regulator of protease activity HflC (stomatin/prohibitin superfamily)